MSGTFKAGRVRPGAARADGSPRLAHGAPANLQSRDVRPGTNSRDGLHEVSAPPAEHGSTYRLVLVDALLRDGSCIAAGLLTREELEVVAAGAGRDFGEAAAAVLLPFSRRPLRLEITAGDASVPGMAALLGEMPRPGRILQPRRSPADLAYAAELRDVLRGSDWADAASRAASWVRSRAPLILDCHELGHVFVGSGATRHVAPARSFSLRNGHTSLVVLRRTVASSLAPEVLDEFLFRLAVRGRRPTIIEAGAGVDPGCGELMTVAAAHGSVLRSRRGLAVDDEPPGRASQRSATSGNPRVG